VLGSGFTTGLVAVLLGYVLGSFPSAYLVTKIATGQDIRRLGGGNVGGLNTYKTIGLLPAVIVILLDIGKGAAVVLLTRYVLEWEQPYVLAAASAAVAGHNWMPWLGFRGGKGMGATVGAITAIFLIYQQATALLFFFGVLVLVLIITHNVTLSNGVALVALPFVCWLLLGSGILVIWSVITGLIIAIKFAPTALQSLAQSKDWKQFIRGR